MQNSSKVILVFGLILLASLTRLIPHPYNFTPIAAMALIGGFAIQNRFAKILFPLSAMVIGDLVLGFHSQMFSVYACFIATVFMGTSLRNKFSFFKLSGTSLSASFLFFVVTNFDVWLQQAAYAKNLQGLLECYAMALPFFHWTIIGDLAYSLVLFGAYLKCESLLLSRAALRSSQL